MNVYSELLELLSPRREAGETGVCFGTISGVEPLCVTVGGTEISRGLLWPRGMTFDKRDLGREAALLPLEDGFLLLFEIEGGNP